MFMSRGVARNVSPSGTIGRTMGKKQHFLTQGKTIQTGSGGPVSMRLVDANRVEMGVDYQKAAVPDRAYYADYCDVVKDRTGIVLLFGKLIAGTTRLRTMIEIAFPREMFQRQLWHTSSGFRATLRSMPQEVRVEPLKDVEPTDKVQTFRSNNVFMGLWGEDSVMDFYFISPRDFYSWKSSGSEITLEPVVRVVLATGVMFEFFEKCETFVEHEPEWPKEAGERREVDS
ncbi:MAG: hypothetical protein HY316_10080 [Acidobacteria bacterium]|nr:hypothetical protein [Acidobacteriota bacterium]